MKGGSTVALRPWPCLNLPQLPSSPCVCRPFLSLFFFFIKCYLSPHVASLFSLPLSSLLSLLPSSLSLLVHSHSRTLSPFFYSSPSYPLFLLPPIIIPPSSIPCLPPPSFSHPSPHLPTYPYFNTLTTTTTYLCFPLKTFTYTTQNNNKKISNHRCRSSGESEV